MSVQAVQKFLGEAASKPELKKRLDSALAGGGDQQEALIAFAASEGYEFSGAELAETARTRELSDGALDGVAGGQGVQQAQQAEMQAKELQELQGRDRLGNFEIQNLMRGLGKAQSM